MGVSLGVQHPEALGWEPEVGVSPRQWPQKQLLPGSGLLVLLLLQWGREGFVFHFGLYPTKYSCLKL